MRMGEYVNNLGWISSSDSRTPGGRVLPPKPRHEEGREGKRHSTTEDEDDDEDETRNKERRRGRGGEGHATEGQAPPALACPALPCPPEKGREGKGERKGGYTGFENRGLFRERCFVQTKINFSVIQNNDQTSVPCADAATKIN